MAFTTISSRQMASTVAPGRKVLFRLLRDYSRVDFLISKSLAEVLNVMPGDRFMVEMGYAEDFGTFRLVKVGPHDRRGNRIRCTMGKHFVNFTVTLKKQIDGVDRRSYGDRFPSRAECEFDFDREAETLTVKVPVEPASAKLRAA